MNFELIGSRIDVAPALAELDRHEELWNQNLARRAMPNSGHGEVDDIWVRFNQIVEGNEMAAFNDLECINYPAFWLLSEVRKLLDVLSKEVKAEKIGRVFISRIAPGRGIKPHCDEGANPAFYTRYHICLQAGPLCTFRAEQEVVEMAAGECWRVNNRAEHEVFNGGTVDRIHLVCDLRVPS